MIKAIVVPYDYNQFATYIRNRGFVREHYGCYIGCRPKELKGLPAETPVHWLEGWSDNPNIKADDIYELKGFTTHKQISERRIYNEGISF